MIPKFAAHLLHHTSRAAASAQNYAFRNVLGFQPPSSASSGVGGWSGAGSSSWGGYGAGPGGAKYGSGSRFYSGYEVGSQLLIPRCDNWLVLTISAELGSLSNPSKLSHIAGPVESRAIRR